MTLKNLSFEDLSFFDNHSSLKKTSNQTVVKENVELSSELHESQGEDDEDDFGDFVEFGEMSNANTDELLVNIDASGVLSEEQSIKKMNDTASREDGYSIQQQINHLSMRTGSIKFGQHLYKPKVGSVMGISPRPTSLSTKQWNDLLTATPGPNNRPKGSSSAAVPVLFDKPKEASIRADNLLQVEDDGWGSFDIEDEFTQTTVISADIVPDSETLLRYIRNNFLPVINKLLDPLATLSPELKEQVLGHEKTRMFIHGYLEAVHVTGLILAGRRRRAESSLSAAAVDDLAQQIEGDWQMISQKIQYVIGTECVPLDVKYVFSDCLKANLCNVCGLTKTEYVKHLTRPVWSNEIQGIKGHRSCQRFWEGRQAFNIP